MSAARLEILLVDDDGPVRAAAAAALRRRGHVVHTSPSAADALALAPPDVLVCGTELVDATGLELLAELRRRGSIARAVLLGDIDARAELREALRLGVGELLARPCGLGELVDAVEGGPRPALPADEASARGDGRPASTLRISLHAERDAVEDALRALGAFLVRHGVSPTTRMRATSACAEVLDNVQRHAYPQDSSGSTGRAELAAELDARDLMVRIADQGAGFDPLSGNCGAFRDTYESGLARAAALAEDLRVDTAPRRGTRVTLSFTAYRVDFEEDECIDLSELDWLPPGLARRVLGSLRGSGEAVYNLSPALAVAVGRLLAGATPRQSAERALWS